MEEQNSPLFGLNIDFDSKSHLAESAKWAKFLSIVGFVLCGILTLVGIFASTFLANFSGRFATTPEASAYTAGYSFMFAVLYIGLALLYFFPCLFLYRHSTNLKNALATNNQETLVKSFQNLKIMFRYMGILTIIVLSFYALIIVILIIAGLSQMR
jgi:uncharacterized protein DUF5362